MSCLVGALTLIAIVSMELLRGGTVLSIPFVSSALGDLE